MSKKTESTKTTAVSIVDTTVPDALKLIDDKIKNMQVIATTPFKTSKNLEGIGNIETITEVDKLISGYASIIARERVYNEAAQALKGDNNMYPPFRISGYTAEDWKHDIKLRLAIVEQDQTLKQLEAFKAELTSFMSEADKKAQLYSRMQSFFSIQS